MFELSKESWVIFQVSEASIGNLEESFIAPGFTVPKFNPGDSCL